MRFDGKKEVRVWLPKQLCFDPFMACKMRDRASRNFRKLEDELRFVFTVGLETLESRESKEQNVVFAHENSHGR